MSDVIPYQGQSGLWQIVRGLNEGDLTTQPNRWTPLPGVATRVPILMF